MKRAMITAAAGFALALFQPVANAEVDAKRAQAEANKGKAVGDAVGSMKAKPVHESVIKQANARDLKLMVEWILSL